MNNLEYSHFVGAVRPFTARALDHRFPPAIRIAAATLPAAGILVVSVLMLSAIL